MSRQRSGLRIWCSLAFMAAWMLWPARAEGGASLVVGPGPNDYPSIQAAVDEASDGDTIVVLPGEYAGAVIAEKWVRVQGSGASSIIRVPWNGVDHDGLVVSGDAASGTEISNLRVDGDGEWGCWRGVRVDGANNVQVADTIVDGCYTGIDFYEGDDAEASGNTVTCGPEDGCLYGVRFRLSDDSVASDNTVTCVYPQDGSFNGDSYGLYGLYGTHWVATGNTVTNCWRGLWNQQGDEFVATGNTIEVHSRGLVNYLSSDALIDSNTVTSDALDNCERTDTPDCDGVYQKFGIFSGDDQHGVTHHNTISNNTVHMTRRLGFGVRLMGSYQDEVHHNTVVGIGTNTGGDPTCTEAVCNTQIGILVTGHEGTTVHHNTVSYFRLGIVVEGWWVYADGAWRYNSIDNKVSYNGISRGQEGIDFNHADGGEISHNEIGDFLEATPYEGEYRLGIFLYASSGNLVATNKVKLDFVTDQFDLISGIEVATNIDGHPSNNNTVVDNEVEVESQGGWSAGIVVGAFGGVPLTLVTGNVVSSNDLTGTRMSDEDGKFVCPIILYPDESLGDPVYGNVFTDNTVDPPKHGCFGVEVSNQ